MYAFKNQVALFLIVFCAAVGAWAQGGATGAISGVVQDATGAFVPGATVEIVNTATGTTARTVTTDKNGEFAALLLPVGTYEAKVRAANFAEGVTSGIQVRITETTRLTISLRVKQVEQKVEVNALVANVDTTSAATGESIESQTIRNLPLATQNFQQLLTLSSGTGSALNNSAALGRGDVRIEVNGQREDNNNYQIEGISASDYNVAELTNTPLPSPDVVQEFKVQTSMYDATQGRNGGGNINAILKTGTLHYHGDLFEFFRNDVLNANEYFLKRAGQPRPSIKQNIFGGSFGGPLRPNAKLGFFFVNYQGTRQRSGLSPGTLIGTNLPVIPSDRSPQSLANVFFNGDVTQLDPVAVALLNVKSNQFGGAGGGWLIPSLPGTPGSQANFTFSRPGRFTDDQFTANWDRDFHGGKDKLSSRFFFSEFESFLPFGGGNLQQSLGGSLAGNTDLNFPLDLPVHDRFFSIAETHIFGPALLNEFRFGLVHINNALNNVPIVTASDLGIIRPNQPQHNLPYKFTLASFQIGPAPYDNQTQEQNNFTYLDTVSWFRGKHKLRFGGEYDRVNLDKDFPQTFNGELFFANDNPLAVANPLTDFQHFLQGSPFFSFGGSGVSNHQYRLNNFAFFGQDDVNVTRNLTLNLGLRLEVNGAVTDQLCHIGNTRAILAAQGQNPFVFPECANQLKVPGLVGTVNNTTFDNNYARNWGPRVGFAYDLFGRHTTSIRGGFGIFYVREDIGTVDQLSFSAPFLPITFASGPPGTMATLFSTGPGTLPPAGVIDPAFVPVYSHLTGFQDCNGFTGTAACPSFDGNTITLFGLEVPRRYLSPNVQQWNLTIQRQLPGNMVLEVGYVGTHGVHLRETRDAIQPFLATPQNPITVNGFTITQSTVENANARSRAPGLAAAGYQLFANDAWSHYNSLQTSVTRHFEKGLYLQAAYTWSKSLDATSSGNTAFNTAVNDQTDLRASYGLSDFDRPHRFIVSWLYDLPFMKSSQGFLKMAFANWSFGGIVTFQSGIPFSIIDSAGGTLFAPSSPNESLASFSSTGNLSNAYTSGDIRNRLDHYVDLAAFQPAPALNDGTLFGDLRRNLFRGPFQQNWDFTLTKIFAITERQQVRFGAQFFNVWNHPVFANPSFVDVSGSPDLFGAITSTVGTPRLIQFNARYQF